MPSFRFAPAALALVLTHGLAALGSHTSFAGTTAPVPGLWNTGVYNSVGVLPDGAVDPHYVLVQSADPAHPGPNAIAASPIAAGFWVANNTVSRWIAPAQNEGYPGGTDHPAGDYVYRLTFDLSSFDPNSVIMGGNFAADNSAKIYLNGIYTGISTGGYSPLVSFSISNGFSFGTNILEFSVNNGGGPTGLRVEDLHANGVTVVGVPPGVGANGVELSAPVPNPARGSARIPFTLPRAGALRLVVRDLAGRVVRTLARGEYPAGRSEVAWDGVLDGGARAGSGIYFVALEFGGETVSRRVAWMR